MQEATGPYLTLLEALGEGSFGKVFKALHHSSNQVVAVKIVPVEDAHGELASEVEMLKHCASQYIVQYHGSFVHMNQMWIMMEYCEGASLLDVMAATGRCLTELQVSATMHSSIEALAYLHAQSCIHRDVKAGNLLLSSDGKVKLADFGVAASLENSMLRRRTVIGTPFWMAPEVIACKQPNAGAHRGYDERADIWSLGITAIELAEGQPPHADLFPLTAIFLIPTLPPPVLSEPERWSAQLAAFLKRCLEKEPEYRASARALRADRLALDGLDAIRGGTLGALMAASREQLHVFRNKSAHRARSSTNPSSTCSKPNSSRAHPFVRSDAMLSSAADAGTAKFAKESTPTVDFEAISAVAQHMVGAAHEPHSTHPAGGGPSAGAANEDDAFGDFDGSGGASTDAGFATPGTPGAPTSSTPSGLQNMMSSSAFIDRNLLKNAAASMLAQATPTKPVFQRSEVSASQEQDGHISSIQEDRSAQRSATLMENDVAAANSAGASVGKDSNGGEITDWTGECRSRHGLSIEVGAEAAPMFQTAVSPLACCGAGTMLLADADVAERDGTPTFMRMMFGGEVSSSNQGEMPHARGLQSLSGRSCNAARHSSLASKPDNLSADDGNAHVFAELALGSEDSVKGQSLLDGSTQRRSARGDISAMGIHTLTKELNRLSADMERDIGKVYRKYERLERTLRAARDRKIAMQASQSSQKA